MAPLKLLFSRISFDVVVDVALFGIPFFSRLYLDKPILTVCYHLPRETFNIELSYLGPLGRFLAAVATLLEDHVYPVVYRRVPVLTFSDSTKRDLVSIGFPPVNVRVADMALAHVMVTNSFETEIIQKRISTFSEKVKKTEDPLFVCLGRLKKYKGVQDAIKAMTQLVSRFPNAKLAIVGTGDYEVELRTLSQRLDVDENVLFMGYVDYDVKMKLLKEATALVMPSYKEGFPTPVLEARACGTPVVASDAVGVYEYVANHEGSLVFHVGDWKNMASLMFKVIEANGNGFGHNGNGSLNIGMDWRERENGLVRLVESCFS